MTRCSTKLDRCIWFKIGVGIKLTTELVEELAEELVEELVGELVEELTALSVELEAVLGVELEVEFVAGTTILVVKVLDSFLLVLDEPAGVGGRWEC